ncbi:MAG TPA: stage II sporulation protein M [Bacteroidia bacterium]|nr:stage II sporulation protein M [Bacteroidia bacterium]
MRETDFIEQNKQKWLELEDLLKEDRKDPDKLSRLFVQVTDDLAYSRTFYPNRTVRVYLNTIAQQVFSSIYKNRKENKKRFVHFWKEELPRLVFESRKQLTLSLILFLVSFIIGAVSTAYDSHFPRVMLGDEYVEMTLENIKKGDPMAVYKRSGSSEMFLAISLNNLKVAFMAFVFGAFYILGTVFLVLYNGIMVGAFQYFFYQQGFLLSSSLTIWLHGTLEISGIILGAGAGITMGQGLVFPGTYSRLQSFMLSARRGFRILLGVIPIIVLAAVIESFLTRYTETPDSVKGLLILLSLIVILGYFVWYPLMKSRRGFAEEEKEILLPVNESFSIEVTEIRSNGEIFRDVFLFFKKEFGNIFRFAWWLTIPTAALIFFLPHAGNIFGENEFRYTYRDWFFATQFLNYSKFPFLIFINTFFMSLLFLNTMRLFRKHLSVDPAMIVQEKTTFLVDFLKTYAILFIFHAVYFINGGLLFLVFFITGPFLFTWLSTALLLRTNLAKSFSISLHSITLSTGKSYGLFCILCLVGLICFFLIDSPLVYFYYEIINWNLNLEYTVVQQIVLFLMMFSSYLIFGLVVPIFLCGSGLLYFSIKEMDEANGLKHRILHFAERMNEGRMR